MEMIKYHNNVITWQAKIFYYVVFISFCLLPAFSLVYAQSMGAVVTFQESIISDEEGNRLSFPSFVMVDPATNEVYVIDGKSRITVYTADLYPIHTLGRTDGIVSPQALATDDKGYLYVVLPPSDENPRHRISVYSPCYKHERDIYLQGFEGADSFHISRIAVDRHGNIYVAATHYPGVLYVDGNGRLLDIISPQKAGEAVQISSLSLDDKGRLFLISEKDSHIYMYDDEKNLLLMFGQKGGSSGKLSRPRAVGVDTTNERMYVVDYMRHTIAVYNKEGEYIFEFGGMGWGEGWFQHPSFMTVDGQGRILVADTFNQRVQVFNSW